MRAARRARARRTRGPGARHTSALAPHTAFDAQGSACLTVARSACLCKLPNMARSHPVFLMLPSPPLACMRSLSCRHAVCSPPLSSAIQTLPVMAGRGLPVMVSMEVDTIGVRSRQAQPMAAGRVVADRHTHTRAAQTRSGRAHTYTALRERQWEHTPAPTAAACGR